ncbi:MAG: histidinol-phosphate transaminase [Clostridiales bacterium]|nr:histidinol-phosphate transaminase [Clostridiales bacterium]
MKEFWSGRIQSITPYTPGEQPRERKFIKLNTNENPYPPSPKALEAIRQGTGEALRLYPDPAGAELVQALAEVYGLEEEQIFVGNGSDEVLSFAFQAFFDQGSEIVFPDITYSFYPVYANLFGIRCRTVPLGDDFTLPMEPFLGGNDGVVIANPNAPTGIELGTDGIRRILEGNPERVVIVDEAYVDFGGESVVPLIRDYPNLLVVQTASKSRSLAGLRVGFAFGNPDLIAGLNCVKNSVNSYTLDRLAIAGAAAAVRDVDYFDARRRQVMATRERTVGQLKELGFTVLPSRTNFIFASHPAVSGRELFSGLRREGILVRWFDQPRIADFLRITIGTDGDMDALASALERLTGGKGPSA